MFSNFFFAVVVISFGSGFQHGYHLGVLNIPSKVFQEWIKKTETQKSGEIPSSRYITVTWSTIVSIFSVGGMLGSLLVCHLPERYGRKKCLMWNNGVVLLTIAIFIISKFANSIELFICGRFVAGVNAGLNSGLCQIYLTEIAPDKIRGRVGCSYQVAICFAVLLSQLSGLVCGKEKSWVFLFIVPLLPAAFQVISLYFCPESPKYLLIGKDDERSTEEALEWLREKGDFSDELKEIINEDSLVKQMRITSLKRVFFKGALRVCLKRCTMLNIGQQLCGISIVMYFSMQTFAEINIANAESVIIGLSVVQVVTTVIVAVFVDTIGRRILLMISFFSMALITTVFTFLLTLPVKENYVVRLFTIISTFCFVISYSLGAGPIPWFITAEFFSYSARTSTVAVTATLNWFFNFLLSQIFLQLKDAIGYYVFFIFVILDFFFFCFTIHCRESKKMSPVEIIEMFHNKA